MGQLGTWLRETREAQGISLKDVEAQTRIRQSFLQALEEGDYGALPGPVCVRGFLRNYALYLELDPQEVYECYRQEVTQGLRRPPESETGFRPIDAALEIPRRSVRALVVRIVLIILLLAGAAGAGVWYSYGCPAPQLPAWWPLRIALFSATAPPLEILRIPASQAPTSVLTPAAGVTSAVLPLPTPTPVPTATPTPTMTPSPAPSEPQGIELTAQVIERAWVLVSVDGVVDFQGVLEEGETRQWRGERSIGFRCGNAGGILITIDGEELGPLGERGQVVNQTWTLREE